MEDIAQPYGPLVETTLRVVTWNVWGRYGPWERREGAIRETLAKHDPDVVALVEAWGGQEKRFGMPHHIFGGDVMVDGVPAGIAVLSRWPITRWEWRRFSGSGETCGDVLFTEIDGPRGPVQLYLAALAWRLEEGAVRQAQVREIGAFIAGTHDGRHPTILCGDFNADPDSDEIRMLTGKAETAAPDLVFYDAWATAGTGGPGYTWARTNSWAVPLLWPDRRIDYVFSAWPRPGGAGHPVHCEVIGTEPVDGVLPSDHYGVLTDLRY